MQMMEQVTSPPPLLLPDPGPDVHPVRLCEESRAGSGTAPGRNTASGQALLTQRIAKLQIYLFLPVQPLEDSIFGLMFVRLVVRLPRWQVNDVQVIQSLPDQTILFHSRQ